jgi:putative toxin-antitoxin system antitoxin component (TIGR02293 family)
MQDQLEKRLDREIVSLFKRATAKHRSPATKVSSYSDLFNNKRAIILLINEGIPYSLFQVIKEASPFSENDWSALLKISLKSLQRYKQTEQQFKPSQSEKIIEVAEVTKKGIDTFGDIHKFKLWLGTPNFSMGNVKPMELLTDSYGKEMVISELTRIDHGILV